MKMLDKLRSIVERVDKIDSEIREIKKMAMAAASGEGTFRVMLGIDGERENVTVGLDLDQDGHMFEYYLRSMMLPEYRKKQPKRGSSVEMVVQDTVFLRVLEIMRIEKEAERSELIQKIREMNVWGRMVK